MLAVLCGFICLPLGADLVVNENTAWLELPQRSLKIGGGESAVVTGTPDTIKQAILHLPQGGSHVSYGKVHTRINTEPADVVMKSVAVASGMVLNLDLSTGQGFALKPGRNSVELEYKDQFDREKYFNFLVTFPGDSEPTPLPSTPDLPRAKMTGPGQGSLFAVVIGISKYEDPSGRVKSLQYADKDAQSFADFLRSPGGGSIDGDHLEVLLNEKATAQNVRHALFSFLTQAQPDDTVIIYIAGHGAHDPKEPRNLYLLTADTDPFDMGGTAFPMWQMQDVFTRIVKARRVITIADTCHSYGFTGEDETAVKSHVNNLFNQYLSRYGGAQERAVITASDVSEQSYEDARWGGGHGVFTYFLLRGLSGEADRNHDGTVTASEVFSYLQASVSHETAGKQNPRALIGADRSLVLSTNLNRR